MRLTRWGLHLGWTAGVVFGVSLALTLVFALKLFGVL